MDYPKDSGNVKTGGNLETARAAILRWLAARELVPADGTDDDPATRELLDSEATLMFDAVKAIRRANGDVPANMAATVVFPCGLAYTAIPDNLELIEIEESPGPAFYHAIVETKVAM